MVQRHDIREWESVACTEDDADRADVPPKGPDADRKARSRQSGLFSRQGLVNSLQTMDSIIGGLSNFRVDTVLSAVDKYVPGAQNKIKNVVDKAKAYVNNVSELEMKVLEATNHEPWGPHGKDMQEITNSAFSSEGFYQIMSVCDQRLSESPENWRLVYKTLLLLEYMCKHGPLSVVEALGSYSRQSQLEKLRDRFEFKDPAGRDQGVNVRQRAGTLVTLVTDRDKLNEERDKAAKNKSKYTGVSSSSMSYGGGFSSSRNDFQTSSSNYSSSTSYGTSSSTDFGGSSSNTRSYQRSSSDGTSGGSATTAAAAAPADPVEATKQRIARLRAEGVIGSESAGDSGALGDGALGGPGLDSPTAAGKRQPKKLSQIKIDPSISAAFAKRALTPPPGSSSSKLAAAGGATAAAAAPASSGIDLLGDLDVSAPAAASSAADDWDGFASAAPVAAATAADDWGAFDSAPGSSKPGGGSGQKRAAIDINALLGPLPTTTPAAAAAGGGSAKAPLALDDFGSMAAAPAADPFGPLVTQVPANKAPAAAVANGGSVNAFGHDPFASGGFTSSPAAAAAAARGDPFAASGGVHMLPQASKQQSVTAAAAPKLGPETAKAKDPFADLAII